MYNVLSVEGRGAIQALVVAKIIQIIDKKLNKETSGGLLNHLDHIVSSSTTSFPASLLACGKDSEKIFNEVKGKFYEVFSHDKVQYNGSFPLDFFVKPFDRKIQRIGTYL